MKIQRACRLHRRAFVITATLVVLGALTACGINADDSPRDVRRSAGADNADKGVSPVITASSRSLIYLMSTAGGDGVVTPEARDIAGTLETVLASLVLGPTQREQSAKIGTALPPNLRLGAVKLEGDVATIDLSQGIANLSAMRTLNAVAQIVLTATGVDGVARVVLTVEGQPHTWPVADGSLHADPLKRSDFAALVPGDDTPETAPPTV